MSVMISLLALATLPTQPQMKQYVINLDAAPENRWDAVVADHRKELRLLIALVDGLLEGLAPQAAKELVDAVVLPDEMQREMRGIAKAGGVSYRQILTANMFYEISEVSGVLHSVSKSCTSIVAQHVNGSVMLARNQDYPPPFRALLFQAAFQRHNVTQYVGTTYAGTIGLSTGMSLATSPHSRPWAFSINARHAHGAKADLLRVAVAAAKAGGQIFPVMPRLVLEQAADNSVSRVPLSKKGGPPLLITPQPLRTHIRRLVPLRPSRPLRTRARVTL